MLSILVWKHHQPSAPRGDYLCLQRPLAIQASLGRYSGTKAGQKLRKLSRCRKEFGETGLLLLLNTYLNFEWEMLTVIFLIKTNAKTSSVGSNIKTNNKE